MRYWMVNNYFLSNQIGGLINSMNSCSNGDVLTLDSNILLLRLEDVPQETLTKEEKWCNGLSIEVKLCSFIYSLLEVLVRLKFYMVSFINYNNERFTIWSIYICFPYRMMSILDHISIHLQMNIGFGWLQMVQFNLYQNIE